MCSLTHAFHSVHAAWKRGSVRGIWSGDKDTHTHGGMKGMEKGDTQRVCVRQEREREKVPFFNSGSMGGRALTSSSKQKRKIRKKEEKGSL